jgi:hypothetical protein
MLPVTLITMHSQNRGNTFSGKPAPPPALHAGDSLPYPPLRDRRQILSGPYRTRLLWFPMILFFLAFPISALLGQTQLVGSHFPAEMEFQELKSVVNERDIGAESELAKLDHGRLMLEAGLRRYRARTYDLAAGGHAVIEILTMADARGAYSLLSLLRTNGMQNGPPGDLYAADKGSLIFSSGNYCVRIRDLQSTEFQRRLALSIGNRIGNSESKLPSLVGHIPGAECDPFSARYFLGPLALGTFGAPIAGTALKLPSGTEVLQANCGPSGNRGMITMLSFPTIQLAEEYFESGSVFPRARGTSPNIYTRQTGPLVSILEGNFAPGAADKVLGSIKFDYSVKWIFDRNNQQNRMIWGVPMSILGTVVRSLVFTALLCLISIAVGILLAAGKIYARRRWGRSDDDYFIRLKIHEN